MQCLQLCTWGRGLSQATDTPGVLLLLLMLQTTNALPAGSVLDFSDVLPSDTTHITYPGSLTTPPCTQGVLWHVMQTPLTISRGQVGCLRHVYGL
jgi:carbonic anhydrase